jgi:hypothetical protein
MSEIYVRGGKIEATDEIIDRFGTIAEMEVETMVSQNVSEKNLRSSPDTGHRIICNHAT